MSLKVVFAGTPEFAASSLAALIESEHEIIAVYTQPDRPAGRGRKLTASPVKALALQHDIPVLQPQSLKNEDAQQELASLNADIMIVVAYGLLLPKAVLEIPALGCINVHASLLPRWRGAAPIHRSLLAGDKETGITIMQMDVGLDTGDMLYKLSCPIHPHDTSGELHDRLAPLGAKALLKTLSLMSAQQIEPEKQDDSQACYAHKLEKQEGDIDWSQDAITIHRKIRGLSPWPIAFTLLGDSTIRVHSATVVNSFHDSAPAGSVIEITKTQILIACGENTVLALDKIQLSGGKALAVKDILNAKKELFSVGTKLGS